MSVTVPRAEWVPPQRTEYAWLLGILALGEFLRVPSLVLPWLRDQAAIHAVVDRLSAGQLGTSFPMPYTTTLYHRFLGLWFEWIGEDLLGPRVIAAFLALSALVVTWALGRALGGPLAGLLAVFFAAMNPLLQSTPAVGLPNDPLPVLLVMAAVLFGLERERRSLLLLAGVLYAASSTVRLFHAFLGPVLVLACVFGAARGRRLSSLVALGVGALLGLLPLALWVFGTEGAGVREFLSDALSGTLGMHTDLGGALARPIGARLSETWITFREIALSGMTVAGRTEAPGANPVGFVLVLISIPWLVWRGFGPNAPRSWRGLALWILGGLLVLTFLIGWRSEAVDPVLGSHRAPRYFVLLFPAPWIAAGLFVAGLQKARLRLAIILLSIPSTLLVPVLSGSLEIPFGGTFDVLEDGSELIKEWMAEADAVLLDAPPGTARDWEVVRFRSPELRDLLMGPEAELLARDPLMGLVLRHPQMHFQTHPQLLTLRLRGQETPVEIDLGRVPLPPISPLRSAGAEPVGPPRRFLVALSSTSAMPVQRVVLPGTRFDTLDRIELWEELQPGLRPIGTSPGEEDFIAAKQPRPGSGAEEETVGFAAYTFDLAPRRWKNLELELGRPEDAALSPEHAWLFPTTLYRPELGYGLNHAFVEGIAAAGRGGGLRPQAPVELRVDVVPGFVQGTLRWSSDCRAPPLGLHSQDQVIPTDQPPCESGWTERATTFCSEAAMGEVRLRLSVPPRAPLRLQRLELAAVPGCPPPEPGAPEASEPAAGPVDESGAKDSPSVPGPSTVPGSVADPGTPR